MPLIAWRERAAELAVVAEVLAQAVLQGEAVVLAHARADVGLVDAHVDARRAQHLGRADARQLEELRRLDAPEREDDLAARARCSTTAAPSPIWTPTTLSPSKTSDVTVESMAIVRFGRLATGCKNAAAALTRWPPLMFAIAYPMRSPSTSLRSSTRCSPIPAPAAIMSSVSSLRIGPAREAERAAHAAGRRRRRTGCPPSPCSGGRSRPTPSAALPDTAARPSQSAWTPRL